MAELGTGKAGRDGVLWVKGEVHWQSWAQGRAGDGGAVVQG